MKKLGFIVIPLVIISFLTNCNKKSLDNYTWQEIQEISQNHNAPTTFKIGDTKIVKINDINHKVRIIDFNHDTFVDGTGTAGITFEFADIITNSNGVVTTIWDDDNLDYRESILNNFLNVGDNCIFNQLPEDLRNVIKPVDKKVGVSTDGGKNYISLSFEENKYPKLFPLAHDEITKDRRESYAASNEGTTYEYYKQHDDKNSRIKKVAGLDVSGTYWLRSPRPHPTSHDNSCAWHVSMGGGLFGDGTVYNELFGVAPAFCI